MAFDDVGYKALVKAEREEFPHNVPPTSRCSQCILEETQTSPKNYRIHVDGVEEAERRKSLKDPPAHPAEIRQAS